ncbi:rhomboid family intramembrane serine protease [Pyxidicoccus parkwayensis]|uniref:Rhomboid family intramembrane serine protease n=1 Tax=Pyxidicoccus parkwayensis TaxID=2813578 RepID=A0ABX7NMP9_9BACT|nr:rhomboid family intramembrane serine protease [Pyxidicoccus parkwaysis]QSQ20126.1 rhomboid family intramembrane serine protease [Pyxidicoccus parkwaysis]
MFIFLPLGVDGAELDRLPRVSIGIAAACVLAFLATWVVPSEPLGVGNEDLGRLVEKSLEHSALEVPPVCSQRFLSAQGRALIARARAKAKENDDPNLDVAKRQEQLNARCDELIARADSSLLRRFALVPARGIAQPGWLTYMFLHLGWMHLLGNLLFFYVVGLLLEDAWGRPLFAAFYVAGGLVAGLAHFALEPSSQGVMVGASGAVAACMGAFCLRFSQRRVRVGYFVWVLRIWRGTMPVPGWLWAGLWFGNEVLNFLLWGHDTGVAVMAHIGGFAFGFAGASLMRATRLEERVVAPALAAKEGGWVADPRLTDAQAALDRGDREEARAGFTRVLADHPDQTDAMLTLGRMDLEDGKLPLGMSKVERALSIMAGRASPEAIWLALEQLGTLLPLERLRPATAWRVAQALEGEDAPPGAAPTTEALYVVAGSGSGAVAVRALIRAAELRLAQYKHPEKAGEYLARAKTLLTGDAAALGERVTALEAEVEAALERGGRRGVEPGRPAPAIDAPSLPPRIIPCRILSLSDKALGLESANGQRRTLSVTEVLAVAVGMLPIAGPPGSPPRQTVLTDLVVSWGGGNQGPMVLRINVPGLSLPQLYPGLAQREAFAKLLSDLLEYSNATALPDSTSLREGKYPRFASEAELNQQFYSTGAAAA